MEQIGHRDNSWKPALWGHRGAMAHAPQNTLASFRRAMADGADGIELDVHLSADGQVVVIHDDTVDATTDGHGAVDGQSWNELSRLDAGAWFAPEFAGERIPLLLEVFEALPPAAMVNVELKSGYGLRRHDLLALAGLTVDVVRTCGRSETTVFSSFDPRLLRILARLAPEIDRALLFESQRPWWLALASIGVPVQAWHPQAVLVDATMVAQARRAGLALRPWGAADPAEWHRLAALGADVLIVDDPGAVRSALSSGGVP